MEGDENYVDTAREFFSTEFLVGFAVAVVAVSVAAFIITKKSKKANKTEETSLDTEN